VKGLQISTTPMGKKGGQMNVIELGGGVVGVDI